LFFCLLTQFQINLLFTQKLNEELEKKEKKKQTQLYLEAKVSVPKKNKEFFKLKCFCFSLLPIFATIVHDHKLLQPKVKRRSVQK
jgi:hypothetical protein